MDSSFPSQPHLPSLGPHQNTHFSLSTEAGSPVLQQDPHTFGQIREDDPISTASIALLHVTDGMGIIPSNLTTSHHPSLNPTFS